MGAKTPGAKRAPELRRLDRLDRPVYYMPMAQATRELLLEKGIELLLQHGYHDLGISALLQATRTPKGSFYHHFASKEDYALQVIDLYMQDVHAGLEQCLGDTTHAPLELIRRFFETSEEKYRRQGYLGCLPGVLAIGRAAGKERVGKDG